MSSGSETLFDFGSGTPLPPAAPQSRGPRRHKDAFRPAHATSMHSGPARLGTRDLAQTFKPRTQDGSVIRPTRVPSFVARADLNLLDYLRQRSISRHFLQDIDSFLENYPQLLEHCPAWCHTLSTLPPLEAYLFFIRGYLRPARYGEDAIPPPDALVIPRRPVELQYAAFDSELLDFFDDCGECFNILSELDREVAKLADMFHRGQQLDFAEMKLMALAIHAQPIDALKFYEYCYQVSYLPHRYLGEHNVLSHLPKNEWSARPRPRVPRIAPKSFRWVRNAMAQANDANRNVVPVLIGEFQVYLSGFHRIKSVEATRLCRVAQDMIDHERETGGGRDIVDMVMRLAHVPPPPAPEVASKRKRRNRRNRRKQAQKHANTNQPVKQATTKRKAARQQLSPQHRSVQNLDPQSRPAQQSQQNARYHEPIQQPIQQQQLLPQSFKLDVAAINRHKVALGDLYNMEARDGTKSWLVRAQKEEEQWLVCEVINKAREQGLMSLEEYEYLRVVFPDHIFTTHEDYDHVNPNRYDVLILLAKWV